MSTKTPDGTAHLLWTPSAELQAEVTANVLLEQYKLYVEMADRIAERRHSTNNFFLTINTALVGIVGFIDKFPGAGASSDQLLWAIAVAGIPLNALWFEIVNSYKKIAGIKWNLVADIEERLVIRPYKTEWVLAGKGKDTGRYRPFTHIELFIPGLFAILHTVILVQLVPWGVFRAFLFRIFGVD